MPCRTEKEVHPVITFDVLPRGSRPQPSLYITFGNQSLNCDPDEIKGAKWLASCGYPYIEALKRIKKVLAGPKPIRPIKLAPLQVMFLMELRIRSVLNIDGCARYHGLATEKLVRERLIVAHQHDFFKYFLTDKGQRYVNQLCNLE